MSVSRRFALTALATLALSATLPAFADTYTVTDLGTVTGKANSWVWIQMLNNRGTVAMYANDDPPNPNAFVGDVSFLWDRGNIIPLPGLPGATDTMAMAINDHNQAVGYSGLPGFNDVRAVLWNKGKAIDLGTYGNDPFAQAWHLNNHGQVVGFSYTTNLGFAGEHAVMWEKGKCHLLTPLPNGGGYDSAYSINDKGQIVGQSGRVVAGVYENYAVLWEDRHSAPIPLGILGTANAINDRGQITGGGTASNGASGAFLWEKGVLTMLGTVGPGLFVTTYDINNKGQIVGQSFDDFTFITNSTAVLWEDKVPIDLNTRIPANSGWKLLAADGINERGEIAGFGVHNGQFRAYLLTPVKKK